MKEQFHTSLWADKVRFT